MAIPDLSHPKIPYQLANPLLIIMGSTPGQTCIDCKRLQKRKTAPPLLTAYRCGLRQSTVQHYPHWPACSRFQSMDPMCVGCGAKRLDDCDCEKGAILRTT